MTVNNPFHPFPMPKLTVELVPAPQWNDNLRSHLSVAEWGRLRTACYVKANHKCEICGGVGHKHPVEAHEIWEYDDTNFVQTLKGLIALCPPCHKVKHIGFAYTQGPKTFSHALFHLTEVNEWPLELTMEYVQRQFGIHSIRSQMKWTINLDWLKDSENYISESEKTAREKRSKLAQTTLANMTRKRAD